MGARSGAGLMRVLDTNALPLVASSLFEGLLVDALSKQKRVSFALSGGSTPWPVLDRLARADLDWERVDIYQVDERVVPLGHADRNFTQLAQAFLSRVPAVAHAMPVDDTDVECAARRYADRLPSHLDLIHLGLGSDGHTASLVPGDAVLDVTDSDVAMTGEYSGHRRMTLTRRAINKATTIVWLVSGESKREVLAQLLDGDSDIPAGMISTSKSIVVTDLRCEPDHLRGGVQ